MASKSLQRKFVLLFVDALLITGAEVAAIWLVARPGYFDEFVIGQPWFFVLPVVVNLLAVYFVQGYHLEEIVTPWRGLGAMTLAAATGVVATGFLFFLIPGAPEFSAKVLLLSAVSIAGLLWMARLLYGRILTSRALKENLLIIGTGESALRLTEVISTRVHSPYRVVALLNNPLETDGVGIGDGATQKFAHKIIELAELPALIRRQPLDAIVLGMHGRTEDRLVRAIMELKRHGTKVTELTELYEELTGMMPVQYVGELKMVFENFAQRSELTKLLESIFNRGLGLLALGISALAWPVVVVAQQTSSRGPVFVEKSERVGLGGAPFRILKFRTMIPAAHAVGAGLLTGENDPRVTRVGRVLRKLHLDELPQLINIVRGDMNFIGPRAELVENVRDLEKKIPFYHERHMVKPGLTGWAQVRNVMTSASEKDTLEKIQYDLYYIKHRSLALDLAILIRTVKLIIKGRGTA